MIAIVCDTVYQLMSAVYLAESIDKNAKLVLFLNKAWEDSSRGFDLKKSGRIERVYYYGEEHMKPSHLLNCLYFPKKMLKSLDNYDFNSEFSAIIAPRTGWLATYLLRVVKKSNPNVKMLLIEEGLGEYNAKMPETRFTAAVHKLKQKSHADIADAAYFAEPKLYNYKLDFPVKKLVCDTQSGTTDFLISLFKAEEDIKKLTPYGFLFLNQTSGMGEFDAPYRKAEEEMVSSIASALGSRNDFAVKLHPRANSFDSGAVPGIYSQCPFELYAAKHDIDDTVLISTLSTAMLTPKLLFGREPYLIFTYLLADGILRAYAPTEEMHENNIAFVKNGAALYRDTSKIFIPRNYGELEAAVKAIVTKIQ